MVSRNNFNSYLTKTYGLIRSNELIIQSDFVLKLNTILDSWYENFLYIKEYVYEEYTYKGVKRNSRKNKNVKLNTQPMDGIDWNDLSISDLYYFYIVFYGWWLGDCSKEEFKKREKEFYKHIKSKGNTQIFLQYLNSRLDYIIKQRVLDIEKEDIIIPHVLIPYTTQAKIEWKKRNTKSKKIYKQYVKEGGLDSYDVALYKREMNMDYWGGIGKSKKYRFHNKAFIDEEHSPFYQGNSIDNSMFEIFRQIPNRGGIRKTFKHKQSGKLLWGNYITPPPIEMLDVLYFNTSHMYKGEILTKIIVYPIKPLPNVGGNGWRYVEEFRNIKSSVRKDLYLQIRNRYRGYEKSYIGNNPFEEIEEGVWKGILGYGLRECYIDIGISDEELKKVIKQLDEDKTNDFKLDRKIDLDYLNEVRELGEIRYNSIKMDLNNTKPTTLFDEEYDSYKIKNDEAKPLILWVWSINTDNDIDDLVKKFSHLNNQTIVEVRKYYREKEITKLKGNFYLGGKDRGNSIDSDVRELDNRGMEVLKLSKLKQMRENHMFITLFYKNDMREIDRGRGKINEVRNIFEVLENKKTLLEIEEEEEYMESSHHFFSKLVNENYEMTEDLMRKGVINSPQFSSWKWYEKNENVKKWFSEVFFFSRLRGGYQTQDLIGDSYCVAAYLNNVIRNDIKQQKQYKEELIKFGRSLRNDKEGEWKVMISEDNLRYEWIERKG